MRTFKNMKKNINWNRSGRTKTGKRKSRKRLISWLLQICKDQTCKTLKRTNDRNSDIDNINGREFQFGRTVKGKERKKLGSKKRRNRI